MSDWGHGARSGKGVFTKTGGSRSKFFTCSKCGQCWTFMYNYDSDLRQIQDGYGNYLCKNCRINVPRRTASPPPSALQMTIEEMLRTKQ